MGGISVSSLGSIDWCQKSFTINLKAVCVLKDQRATRVSARQERAPARYVRAARSVFRIIPNTFIWGFLGVSV